MNRINRLLNTKENLFKNNIDLKLMKKKKNVKHFSIHVDVYYILSVVKTGQNQINNNIVCYSVIVCVVLEMKYFYKVL